MLVSFFKNNFCTEIDYSSDEECLWAFEITDEQLADLINGKDYEIIQSWKVKKLNIFEWENYLQKLELENLRKIDNQKLENERRKQEITMQLWLLKQEKDWLVLLWKETNEVDSRIEELKKEYISI